MSTFEVIVVSIVIAGSSVVSCVALAFYGKKSERTANVNIESIVNYDDTIPKTPIIENSANLDDLSPTETMLTKTDESSQVKSEPEPVSPPVPSISTFQASSSESSVPDTRSTLTELAQHESAIPKSSNGFETASIASNNQDSGASSEDPALTLPTDISALENIPSTAFAIGTQNVSSNISTSGAGANYRSSLNAYCVKCRSKKQIRDPTAVVMKNGRAATSGFCCDCGTKVFRIGKSAAF
jgi:hypothetical protein